MKLVTYNTRYSLGQDGRYDLTRIAHAVEGADVIALQEIERNWRRTAMADQPAALAELLPGYHWVYGPAFDVDASRREGNETTLSRRRQFGTMLLSKTPILSSRLFVLPKLNTQDAFNMTLGALEGVIEAGASTIRVYSLHLSAMTGRERMLQLDALFAALLRATEEGGAWSGNFHLPDHDWDCGEQQPPMPEDAILMGDFNCEPDSPEYVRLTGGSGVRIGSEVDGVSFADAWVAAGHDCLDVITRSPYPGAVANRDTRFDYCFVSQRLAGRVGAAWVDHQAKGSDHYPCWFEVDLEAKSP